MKLKQPLITSLAILWMMTLNLFGQVPKMMQPQRLVNDYINLLPESDLAQIESQLVQFDNETSIQVAVVIVSTTNGNPISDMAFEIGESWGVGQKGLDNGVVFLIAIDDRKMFIATGYGVEGYLPDATCTHICDETVKPFFKKKDYPAGIKAGVDQIVDVLGHMSWEDREAQKQALEEQARQSREQAFEYFLLGAAILLVLILILVVIRNTRRRRGIIREKTEQINALKTFFEKILGDVVALDHDWPNWAKEAFAVYYGEYQAARHECENLIKSLPSNRGEIYELEQDRLDLIERKLEKFDEIDREATKIREDVKTYHERAPHALSEAKERLQKVVETTSSMAEHHTVSSFNAELDRLKTILTSLTLNTADDYRRTFEKAFGVSQKLKVILTQMKEEEELREKLTNEIPVIKDRFTKGVPRWVNYYREVYRQITANFSGLSLENLLTLTGLKELVNRAGNGLLATDTAMASATPMRYAMAHQNFIQAVNNCDAVQNAYAFAKERLEEIRGLNDSFSGQAEEVHELVRTATKAVKDSDVNRDAREAVRSAVASLEKAETLAKLQKPDWLGAHEALETAATSAATAITEAKKDIAAAKRARHSSNYSSSYSSRSSSSSSFDFGGSSSGGGFGGFGGGSFGGGGGGGSW